MRKATSTNKALFLLTFLFIVLAALSFTAFRETKTLCTGAQKCSEAAPVKRAGGQMLWDDFSRRLVSCVSAR